MVGLLGELFPVFPDVVVDPLVDEELEEQSKVPQSVMQPFLSLVGFIYWQPGRGIAQRGGGGQPVLEVVELVEEEFEQINLPHPT